MIKDFTPRLYQETIFATAAAKNTLVVLPTGLGKTNIFLMLAAQRLKQYPKSKILFLAPTRPLVEQHVQTFQKYFDIDKDLLTVFTGTIGPEKRKDLWKKSTIIFSTPQTIENDIISNRIDLKDVSLLGIDEVHRAIGNYAYVFVAKQYTKKAEYARILALTASPGSDKEKIKEICQNMFVEAIEVRTYDDPDVKSYVQKIKQEWVKVQLPQELKDVQIVLKKCYQSKLADVKKYGYANSTLLNKIDVLKLQGQLQGRLARGEKDFVMMRCVSLLAEAMKVAHAIELVETQGVFALARYMEKMESDARIGKSKAVKNLMSDPNLKVAKVKVWNLKEAGVKHPKVIKLKEILTKELANNPKLKLIVFTQYRDSATEIVKVLNTIDSLQAKVFVGQTKKSGTGLSQKEQKAMLDEFRQGEFNVLVSTSVGEEGLDIPAVDLVVFYEPVPSAIRTIQRRGRTGRHSTGRIIMLVAEGTRDVGYRWSAYHKEKRMHRVFDEVRKEIILQKVEQPKLSNFIDKNEVITIVVDHRERNSGIPKELVELGLSVSIEQLDSADYLCSAEVAVEHKTVPDFLQSIIDGRLLAQLRVLKNRFSRPLIIIEGEEDLYALRNIHANAIRGMLATITISYGIPVLQTKDAKETARLLAVIAKREQKKDRDYADHVKKPLSLSKQQEYVLASFPSVGPNLAKDLLKHFGSVKNAVNASEKELMDVPKLGKVIMQRIKDVLDKEYKED